MANKRGNNEGTIYQRSDGKYRAQISLDGRRLSFTAETHKECLDWIRDRARQIDHGLTYDGAITTLDTYMEGWLTIKSTEIEPSTERQYRQITRDYILPQLGSKILLQLKTAHIQALYITHLNEGVSARVIELVHAILRNAFNDAINLGLLTKNPTAGVKKPKHHPRGKTILNENQIQDLLLTAEAIQPEFLAFYHLALSTGMRLGELLGTSWDDLDWDKGSLTVNQQLQRVSGQGLVLKPPKTRAGHRSIKLGPNTLAVLREHRKFQGQRRLCRDPDWDESNLMFTQESGAPWGPRQVQRAFKKLLSAADLPDMRFHDLRHTSGTHMMANKVDPVTVQRRLGHANASTTMNTYGHTVPWAQEKAAEVMDEITTPVALPPEITAPKPSDLNVEIRGGCTENAQNCTEKSTGCTEVAPKIAPISDDKMKNSSKP